MSETILKADIRKTSGKAAAGRTRREGRVPAIIYGEIDSPASITLDAHELKLLLREKQSLMTITLDGEKHRVIVRDIQYHPVSSDIIHIDFMEVKKGTKLTMTVPLTFIGKPEGVQEGGMLDEIRHEVTISVLPKDIPNEIVVNVESLMLGDSIRLEDIEEVNFEFMDEPNTVLCRVEIPRAPVEEEEAEEEELEDEEMAEPEVITARDKEESEE